MYFCCVRHCSILCISFFDYELKWLNLIANGQLGVACKFQNISQLINDPVGIDDGSNYEKNVKEIYPREVQLYEANVSLLLASKLEYYLPIVYGYILVKSWVE